MGRKIFGTVLLLVALFMAFGFFRARPDAGATLVVTLLIAVVLPAAGGVYLWWSASADRAAALAGLRRHKALLLRQTLQAELLKLAERRGGKLTVVEAVGELAFDADTVGEALEAMAVEGLAEVEVSESGVIVYAFRDVIHLGEKAEAKGVLDA